MSGAPLHRGACLCGAVRFEVSCALPGPDACHCSQCRKTSGHFWASTDLPRSAVTIEGADNVTWYRSSEKVRRGFCAVCGSTLFWDPIALDWTAVALGALDAPTGAHLALHIFVAEKGDYYTLDDGLPRHERFPPRK